MADVKLINRLTGTIMAVAEERLEEYLAAGHMLAAAPARDEPPKEPVSKKPQSHAKKAVKK